MDSTNQVTLALMIRIAIWAILLILVTRATYFRVRAYRRQRDAKINGLRMMPTIERLWRVAIKIVVAMALGWLIVGRLGVDDIDLRMLYGDIAITVVTLAMIAFLAVDDYWAGRMIDYDRDRHPPVEGL